MATSIGYSGYGGYDTTTIYYPSGDQPQADTLANQIAGSVVKATTNVSALTLVIGANAPSALVAASSTPASPANQSLVGTGIAPASPSPTISAQTRNDDENLCPNLPGVVSYGGSPSD